MATQLISRGGGSYFDTPSREIEFIHSGCQLFDCVLGGGYPLGRIVNIVGDKSTGKTLLAIEAAANFLRDYPDGKVYYNEAEAAFDKGYASALGMPTKSVEFVENCNTVEDLFEDLRDVLRLKGKRPSLYILDSLDALSDRAEAKREIGEGSFGAAKAKKMSELFRRLTRRIAKRRFCVLIISQVRDNIGVTFGAKYSRSGGKALDFYASQVVYLAQIQTLRKTINKVVRPIGVAIKAKCTKNKVGLPLRECEFTIRFGYGVDDMAASVEWLESVGRLDLLGLKPKGVKNYLRALEKLDPPELAPVRAELEGIVRKQWSTIEKSFLPQRKKYA